MSSGDSREVPPQPSKLDPETLVLRGRPRPVIRFRRGLIVGISGALAAALATLAWVALEPAGLKLAAGSGETAEAPAKAPAEALGDAPATYGDVPKLGPPLPGDLGRPILESRRESGLALPEAGAASSHEAARERRLAAEVAARSSGVIVPLAHGGSAAAATPEAPSGLPAAAAPVDEADPSPRDGQQRKLAFAGPIGGDALKRGPVAAPSPWTLVAGTVISASLVTGLNSDLPGMATAQVTQNVYDSATGRTLLIPQGARLIGRYDSKVSYGQRRALLVWDRILFPDGSSAELDSMPATDAAGHSGLSDRVDSHGWQLLKGVVLSSLLGVGTQLSLGGESDIARALRESTQQNAAHAGDRIVSRDLDVQPTLTVRPGWRVSALVHKDLVLRPWRD